MQKAWLSIADDGEVCGKGPDGRGGHWWVREAQPSTVDGNEVRGKEWRVSRVLLMMVSGGEDVDELLMTIDGFDG